MKLLLIEDDQGISLALSKALTEFVVEAAGTGAGALAKLTNGNYALIVLDLNLPDMSGLEVCRQLRSQGNRTPILILSCEARVLSKISLLDAGADDYLTKPFSLGELKVRLRVLLRRNDSRLPQECRLSVGDLSLDSEKHAVERNGQPIRLRRKEFALLECLMQRAGTVVTRQTLCDHAWRGHETPWANTVDVHIKYLRDKVDRPFDEHVIKTVHGLGYKIESTQSAAAVPGDRMSILQSSR